MVVPLQCDPGTEKVLATPDADSPGAYTWKGGSTSAQYYVNNAGVSVEKGCLWGQEGSEVGNYAPYVRLTHSLSNGLLDANAITDLRFRKEG